MLNRQVISAVLFILIGITVVFYVPSTEIAWVCCILLLTIYLFALEVVPVDVAAICIMILLGLTTLLGPSFGLSKPLVDEEHLFSGFGSNAVISIIAVIIMGSGLDKTGLMSRLAIFLLRIGGTTERRITPLIAGTAGVISGFMQNVGAAALLLPVISRISARSGIAISRLAMPMGFCAILGGTLTMVGSSPLILLDDLMENANTSLPADKQMGFFNMFDVTPIGLVLIATGILYFVLAGRWLLPSIATPGAKSTRSMDYFEHTYGVGYVVNEVEVPAESSLVGTHIDDFEHKYQIRVVGMDKGDGPRFGANSVNRELCVEAGSVMAILSTEGKFKAFVEATRLVARKELISFADAFIPTKSGIAEILIHPNSEFIGKSARDLNFRRVLGISLLAIHRGGKTITREGEGVRNTPLQSGDVLVVHITWQDLARLEGNSNVVLMTTEFPHEEIRPHKVAHALTFFALAMLLVLFTDLKLSVALFVGALGMILSGVLSIEEAYQSVSWKSVFLLGSLIPLGEAVTTTGTAAWIAEQVLHVMGGVPVWVLQAAIAILATVFTLVMSNVGATVLLVPLAVNIAIDAGADPAMFALTVAISTSNSFIIPTHQVNAIIMGPAGYRVADFIKVGGIMTLLFLVVSLTMLNLLFTT